MELWNRDNTALIMAGKGFRYEGCIADGYNVFSPYVECRLPGRLLREVVFRTPIPTDQRFYNKEILNNNWSFIIVFDTLITKNYLIWLRESFPDSKIIFKYENMVGKARHIFPEDIPDSVDVWTYDSGDSQRYGMKLFDSYLYFPSFVKEKKTSEYDLFYIGRDKGRGENILELERKLNELGVKTKFIITADGRFSKKKPYYQKELSYDEVTDCLAVSKAVLNIALEGQRGITIRDAESVFFNIKLITTNSYIKNADFYDPDKVFILTDDNCDKIPSFLDAACKTNESLLKNHTMDVFINEVCAADIT